jgi:hypothetical protein
MLYHMLSELSWEEYSSPYCHLLDPEVIKPEVEADLIRKLHPLDHPSLEIVTLSHGHQFKVHKCDSYDTHLCMHGLILS